MQNEENLEIYLKTTLDIGKIKTFLKGLAVTD